MPRALGFGGSKSSGAALPTSFSASTPAYSLSGGLDASGNSVGGSLTRLGSDAQNAFGSRFPRLMGDIDTLRGTLTPGYSQLREAASREVSNARTRGIGNLRENLARRRILGSSFGEDALSRAEAEFGDLAARTQTQSFLAELDANMKVMGFEFDQIDAALTREFEELKIASNFTTQIGALVSDNRQFAGRMAAADASSRAKALGTFAGLGLSAVGGNGLWSEGGIFGAGTGMAATAGSAATAAQLGQAAMLMSDRRLKTDVSRIGSLPNGLPVYRYRYVWGGPERVGVMAQDVERVMPEAVVPVGPWKAVNYSLLLA